MEGQTIHQGHREQSQRDNSITKKVGGRFLKGLAH